MRKILVSVLSLCLPLAAAMRCLAQNGPDNDPDGLPGYVDNVFHHGSVDSINLYNGQLTIPIALGPSYPVGPKLRVQAALTYNSRVWEYGHPAAQDPFFTTTPISGDPALGIGWGFTFGAIKACPNPCFVGPDGSRHIFETPVGTTDFRTTDASPLYLRALPGSGSYQMWDADGNRYDFTWQVSGFDDVIEESLGKGFTRDFGRGRDGWYATSVTDPFGNSYGIQYFDASADGIAFPCWTYGDSNCASGLNAGHMICAPAGKTRSWIPRRVLLPGGSAIVVHLNGSSQVASVDFPVLAGGASRTATWTLTYDATPVAWPCAYQVSSTINVRRLTKIALPAEILGSPAYKFAYGHVGAGIVTHVDLPTGGALDYCYASYSFFHGRIAAMQPACSQQAPPAGEADAIVQVAGQGLCLPALAEDDQPPSISGGCSINNEPRWLDRQFGVVRRSERTVAGGTPAVTAYTQYAFPWGEQGSADDRSRGPQTLTVIVAPADADGHKNAKAVLFHSGPKVPSGAFYNGDRTGADVEERVFDLDPNAPGATAMPVCGPGASPEQPFCASKSVRVTRRTYDYDIPSSEILNRRLLSETTYHDNTNPDGTCPGCPYHVVSFSNTGANTWEGNGRHYNTETHAGNLGNDARTVTTAWAPAGWTSGPPPGAAVLPNLLNQRTATQGASVRDEYFEHDTATGFLKGSFVYDAARDTAFLNCRYDDADGNVDKEFTRTFGASTTPARTYCSSNYPNFPSVGTDGDTFGKDYSFQNGQVLTARWINGSVGTATFLFRNLTRDTTTGWITSAKDTAGLATAYVYDILGRVTAIDPPGADLSTFVCYESPNATTAYRAAAAQACPVSPGNAQVSTWEHYDYDGLGRAIRERRLLPAGQVSKRFTLYDGPGRGYFVSEWAADATAETISRDLATACVFASSPAWGTARSSAAPGTLRLCFDPFGRPQQVEGSKHSGLATFDRSDAGRPYSDTAEKTKVYCVNATFANLQQASCAAGGLNPETTTRKDAYGRVTKVTEPTAEDTTYVYDVNGKLTSVAQGVQTRTFGYDASGLVRSEATPEKGVVSYDSIGSLGNVRQETQPGGLILTRKYDFAGRLTEEDAAGARYVVNCYDGAATCVDGSPGAGGGSFAAGKLTRRYGFNFIPTIGPAVDEQFEYGDAGGRLSKIITSVGNGDLSSSTTQTWTYGNLGLVATHAHPRSTGSFTVTDGYAAGLPASIAAGGQTVVAAATYNPASGLASWTAGNSGSPIVTTIAQDSTLLARPASISNSFWSSGTFTYDSAGDILKMGGNDSFAYDSRARLVSATYSPSSRSFGYDRYGNLTQNGSQVFDMDASHNRLKASNPGAPAYDLRGNLTSYNGDTMGWDALDRQYRNSSVNADWIYISSGAGERLAKFPASFGVLRREMARYIAEANVIAKGWTLPACAQIFTDVACADPDARQIQLVSSKGITAGCLTNPPQFCPDRALTRAEMAVFLVKGYKPDGFTPPACVGTIFQDVTCAGPYTGYAPWIEQLSRDGVTAGCSTNPPQFCPGNTVGEWEMLVWMAKAPASSPGTLFWPTYHPVPRGAIYTLRDEQNRVVTEMAGGLSGASTATLSVTRDNVFLGSLLVASSAASPTGWQYTASDHLGSPRVTFNQSGQLVETHKYWPYGEDTNPAPPNQRLAFCLMERDAETSRFYDHARTHDLRLGRFLSPDRIGGHPLNPQSWNRYAYTLNNPLKHIDPDGNLTIVTHGTFAANSPDFRPGGAFFEHVRAASPDRTFAYFKWSGNDSREARESAARAMASFIRHYKFAPGEGLTLALHSHAGNVGIAAINSGLGRKVDNLVTLGTPSRPDYRLQDSTMVGKWINLYNSFDQVQVRGGGDGGTIELGPAARTQPFAINVNWNLDFGPVGSHSALHSPAAWDFVKDRLNKTEALGTEKPDVVMVSE